MIAAPPPDAAGAGAGDVLRNRPFLLLWLSQAATQIGGNMVLYGLTVVVSENNSNSAVSALILTFLVPAVLFSAVAGVYVDRLDRRLILVVTNVLRAVAFVAMFFVGDHLLALLLLNIFVSTVTVFFAPAEAAMIPYLVPRRQLIAANGIFTLTLNAAFALGFALLGPLLVTLLGAPALLVIVAALYLVAAVFCWTLPAAPPVIEAGVSATQTIADAEKAVETTIAQLREGISFISGHRNVIWSLIYLGIAASLVGVLGVLGPNFAKDALGLQTKDFVVVVLPLGAGIVMGILLLNSYGRFLPRRRVIEGGLISLGLLLGALSASGPISRWLRSLNDAAGADLGAVTSLLAIVVVIAFLAGIAYAAVAIPAQTQLQEDLPEDVRGRVFGVLNMLVSVSSFLPIIIVGPLSDILRTGNVFLAVAVVVLLSGVLSVVRRGPLAAADRAMTAEGIVAGAPMEPIAVVTRTEPLSFELGEEGVDDDIAPWIIAAGWTRRDVEPPADDVVEPAVGEPPEQAAADPLGLAPDDPQALSQAETAELRLPWGPDASAGEEDRDRPEQPSPDPDAPERPPGRTS